MNIFTKIASVFSSKNSENNTKELSLKISSDLKDFLEGEVLPGLDINANTFWKSFESIVNEFAPRNKELLEKREDIQSTIDKWHLDRKGEQHNHDEYKKFLEEIGYIAPRSPDFLITTDNVDPEIKTIAGPQLVVPVMNARFALNAANARWGSLYDALYGTDVISEDDGAKREGGYNPVRGDKVIEFAKNFLDETIPLEEGSYQNVLGFDFSENQIYAILESGKSKLKDINQYVGYCDYGNEAYGLLYMNNNLHFEIQVDPNHSIGQTDKAGIKDILMESAITTIQDCEDSVAAVEIGRAHV